MSIKARNALSVLIGIITIVVVGFLLSPVLELAIKKSTAVQNYYSFFSDSLFYEFIWVSVASFFGAFVTSFISRSFYCTLITGAFAVIMILAIGIFVNNNLSIITFLAAAISYCFCLVGRLTQKGFSIKKV
ncbi:MAG: hypothetical protein ABI685_06950 [Ferruginibacter sp.]